MKQGWKIKKLGEVLSLEYGKPLSKEKRIHKGLYPVYGANGIINRTNEYYIDKPSIIVGRKGSAGEINYTEEKFWPLDVTYYTKFDKNELNLNFLYYLLSLLELPKLAKGVKPGINRNDVYAIKTLIPPISEQKRIVAKLNQCFEAIDKARANVEKNLNNAKELFYSNLQYAIEGELTKSQRKKQLKQYVFTVNTDIKTLYSKIENIERKKNRRVEKTKGHETILKAIPDEWNVTTIDSIFDIIDYRGKTPVKSERGARLISAKNIRMGYIDDNPVEYVSNDTYEKWMVRGFPKLNDIFFVTEGHTMGFTALNNRIDKFALAQRTITLQPVIPFFTKFFFYYMMSEYFQKLIKINATGAAAIGIKASKFKSLILPFPSFSEQKIIVEKLDELKDQTQSLKSNYQQELDALDELKKSILQKAFSGEL
ncbi:MAG: restriction endonuclease subunit S [Bacteroidales bacterium]|nr:restriction endonuclease subunit S [Bacteroidales bacterium]